MIEPLTAGLTHRVLAHLELARARPSVAYLGHLIAAYGQHVPWESASRIARHAYCLPGGECPRWPEIFWEEAISLGTGLLVGTVPAALIGFACLGLGSGCIVPTVMTLAGNQPDLATARAVALINLGEWPAFLLGPPLIGGLAQATNLTMALGVLVIAAVLLALGARSVPA